MRVALGPWERALDAIREAREGFQEGRARIAVAWARDEGARWLLDLATDHITDLRVLVGLNERGTTVEALLRLLPRTSYLGAFFKHPRQTFHPKFYLFDEGTDPPARASLVVGSSNLTRGGLVTNFEASTVIHCDRESGAKEDGELIDSAIAAWEKLVGLPFAIHVSGENCVKELYDGGYLVTEKTIRRQRRASIKQQKAQGNIPTSPPPAFPGPPGEPIEIPFELTGPDLEDVPPDDIDPEGVEPVVDRFFVRTLTPNDVAKLHGETPGTFEPDLGVTARDQFPSFWGWSDNYVEVNPERRQWEASALLLSSATPTGGVPITAMLWFREERPGHPAEHRISPRPIGVVRDATPDSFDIESLLVVERAAEDSGHDFVIRLITAEDAGYEDFSAFLTEDRPAHRYGYGP